MELRPHRILVVDDEPPTVDIVTGYFERVGWVGESAAGGATPTGLEIDVGRRLSR